MSSYKAVVAIFLCCVLTKISAGDLPSFLHVCHTSDPNLNQCLVAAVEDIRPFLITGVPEYNIPSLEPLVMQDLISEELAGVKIVTSNVTAYGCSDYFVRDINIDKDSHTYIIHIDLPKLRIFAHYNIDGKILLLPVRGNGNLEANITDCVSTTTLVGEIYEKEGINHLRFVSSKIKVKIGEGHVLLGNLFNGDKIMLGVINDVVNRNLDAFLKEIMPAIERALAAKFLEIGNDVVNPFTFEQLFPK